MSEALDDKEIDAMRQRIATYDADPRRKGMVAAGVTDDRFADDRRVLATIDHLRSLLLAVATADCIHEYPCPHQPAREDA